MDEMARQQGAQRWAGNAPEEILHLWQIKETVPDALVIHMIRDGRDVCLSLSQSVISGRFPGRIARPLKGPPFTGSGSSKKDVLPASS